MNRTYARTTKDAAVVIVINNDTKPADLALEVSPAGLANGMRLIDRLGASKDVQVENGNLRVALPSRSVAIFVRK